MIVDRFGIHVLMCFLSFLDGEDVNEVIISTWEKGSSRRLYRMGMKCDILSLKDVDPKGQSSGAEIDGCCSDNFNDSDYFDRFHGFEKFDEFEDFDKSETLIDLTIMIDIGIAINNLRHLMCYYRRQSSGVVCGLEVAINFCSP